MRRTTAPRLALTLCLALAARARAQVATFVAPAPPVAPLMLPAPAISMPSSGLTAALPSLAPAPLTPSLILPPAFAPAGVRLQGSLQDFGARAHGVAPAPGDGLIQRAGASESFAEQVRSLLASVLPEAVLRDLAGRGYRILIKDHLTQDRPDLPYEMDQTGGLHDWGPLGSFIMVAERIRSRSTGEWMQSRVWRNAAVHETGHGVDRILGLTDSEEYRTAWEADYAAIPDELKRARLADGRKNDFFYFLRPGADGGHDLARQETFAEAFDILFRGKDSAFNYESFTRWFPKTLGTAKELLEKRYGKVVP